MADPETILVFLSYRRAGHPELAAFGKQVQAKLENEGFEVWRDEEDIPYSEDWWQAIREGIQDADAVIQIITTPYMESQSCNWEMYYAHQLRKKRIPLLYQQPNIHSDGTVSYTDAFSENVAEKIKTLRFGEHVTLASQGILLKGLPPDTPIFALDNWNKLRFSNFILIPGDRLDSKIDDIVNTVRTDYEHAREHTRLLKLAQYWDEHQRSRSSLIRGSNLNAAENWLISSSNKNPEPSPLQQEFIRTSRKASNRWLRFITIISIATVVVLAGLAIYANFQRVEAVEARDTAEIERDNRATQEAIAVNQAQTLALSINSALIPVGNNPSQPVQLGNELWISNLEADAARRVSADTGTPIGSPISVGSNPLEPVSDGHYLWVASTGENRLTRIDPQSTEAPLEISLSASPRHVMVAGGWIWVTTERQMLQLNPSTGEETNSHSFNATLAIPIYDGTFLWVAERISGMLHRIDASTGAVQSLAIEGSQPFLILGGGNLWIADITTNTLTQIDSARLMPVQTRTFTQNLRQVIFWQHALWAVLKGDQGNLQLARLESIDLTQQQAVDISQDLQGADVISLVPYENQIWVFGTGGKIFSYHVSTLKKETETFLPNVQQLSTPSFEESQMWISESSGQNVYVLDQKTGSVLRRLPICGGPIQPLYDGANMWVSCQKDGLLARIPAYLYYYGIGERQVLEIAEFERNSRAHTPIFDGNRLWLIQEVAGRLIIFNPNSRCVVGALEVGAYPALPVYENGTYWLGKEQDGSQYQLLRFDTRRDDLNNCNLAQLPFEALNLPQEPGRIQMFGGKLWIDAYTNKFDTEDGEPIPSILVVDADTMQEDSPVKTGVFSTGITALDDHTVLVSAAEETSGSIYAVTNGNTEKVIEIDYLPTAPIVTSTGIWVSGILEGGAVNIFGEGIMEAPTGAIFRFDPDTYAQELFIPLPDSPSELTEAGRYLWFIRTSSPPMTSAVYSRDYHSLTALDPVTGEEIRRFTPCENLLPPYFDEESGYLWAVCWGLENDPGNVLVIDPISLQIIHSYENLGREAWPAVGLDDQVWIVYRGTGNAVVFCRDSGVMVGQFALGDAPSPPVVDSHRNVWVMNSGSATLQSIRMQNQCSSE